MRDEQLNRVQSLFEQALDQPPTERKAFLIRACDGDDELRAEVESLLEHDGRANTGFMRPASPPPEVRNLDARSPADAPETIDAAERLIGAQLGRYHIKSVVGSGGMGTVYEAVQDQPHRVVALKVMRHSVASHSALRRFQFESQVLARLRHPNIAQVYDAGMHDIAGVRLPFFAMEYIPGARSLTEYADGKRLSVHERLTLFARVCDAVNHGHQRGIIHRDLKPANVLVDSSGEPKVIDFGVARATDSDLSVTTQQTHVGQLVGTVQYMSPEQCDGDPHELDTRTDVYSLGVTLYELLTATLPYELESSTLANMARTIRESSPRRLSSLNRRLCGDVETIVLKAMEKDRDRRYESAAGLAADIRRFLAGEAIAARPPSMVYLLRKFMRRHTWQAATIGASVLLFVVALVTVGFWGWAVEADRARVTAEKARSRETAIAYGSRINAADAALAVNDPAAARLLLEEAESAAPRLCGWEWRHLTSRVDESIEDARFVSGKARTLEDMALSPDGTRLALARMDGTIEILGVGRGDSHTLRSGDSHPYLQSQPLAWSHDGALLAATTVDGYTEMDLPLVGLSVWQAVETRVRQPVAHRHLGVNCRPAVSFHPTRRLLATDGRVNERGLIQLWNLEGRIAGWNELQPTVIVGAGDSHGSIAWSADGTLLATAAWEDKLIHIWDFSGLAHRFPEKPVATLCDHTYHIMDLAFNPVHKRVLASASLDGTVRLWDLSGLRTGASNSDSPMQSVSAFDALRGHGLGAMAVCFDPWGRRVFVGTLDRTLHVWDVEQIAERAEPVAIRTRVNTLRGHAARITRIVALADGRVVSRASDGELKVWAPDAEDVPLLRGHRSSIHDVAFNPGRGSLFTADGNSRVYEWDLTTGTPRRWWQFEKGVHGIELIRGTPAPEIILSRLLPAKKSEITIAAIAEDGVLKVITRLQANDRSLYGDVLLARNNRRLAVQGDGGFLSVWSRNEQEEWGNHRRFEFGGAGVPAIITLDDRARWLLLCAELSGPAEPNTSLQVWDLDAGQRIASPLDDQEVQAISLALAPDRSLLAVGTNEGPILLYAVEVHDNGIALCPAGKLRGHSRRVFSLAFHPMEGRLVSHAEDESLRVWDLNTRAELATMRGHPAAAACLVFEQAGELLVSGSAGALGTDNVVRLWGTRRTPERDLKRATALRAYNEAHRHIRADNTRDPADIVDAVSNDPTLPSNVRRFAAEHLLDMIKPGEVRASTP